MYCTVLSMLQCNYTGTALAHAFWVYIYTCPRGKHTPTEWPMPIQCCVRRRMCASRKHALKNSACQKAASDSFHPQSGIMRPGRTCMAPTPFLALFLAPLPVSSLHLLFVHSPYGFPCSLSYTFPTAFPMISPMAFPTPFLWPFLWPSLGFSLAESPT
ncbi:hypothetical protein IEO21_07091 [Rhodonia placenta]|uniref:Uncharacterized protein n=1 Tax=Rhodonia placenta TaxID=104341 RepID=A0A8H7NZ68_9APHY|nr:hypothetical protein IEO21_07091 [Postia placenta]